MAESRAPGKGEGPVGRRHRLRRGLLVAGLSLVVLALVGAGVVYLKLEQSFDQVKRIPRVFEPIPTTERPPKPTEGPEAESLNILLAGSDRRSEVRTTGEGAGGKTWVPGAQRSDTIMILHVTGDRDEVYLISIPRDSWVRIPGHESNRINAAFSLGGPSLYVRTVEKLTGLRMDHLAIIDWEGFRQLTNALGGVTVYIPETVYDPKEHRLWKKGRHLLVGDEALDYVRQRYNLPNGDFDRINRQQNYLRSLMSKLLSEGTLSNPLKLNRVLDAVTSNLSVDVEFSNDEMRDLALSLRGIRSNDVEFLTAPLGGYAMIDGQSVVRLDRQKSALLWRTVRHDNLDRYLKRYGEQQTLPQVVR